MKWYCPALKKEFVSKDEMHKALFESKEDIISIKKATIKHSDACPFLFNKKENPSKKETKNIEYGDYVYPVINTSKYLDSHGDVHIDGIWDKSAKEQKGKVFLVVDHELSVGKIITWPKDVEVMVENIEWKDLGAKFEGATQALIFKSKLTERSNKDAFEAYKEKDPVQHSIRMQYVKLRMAINNKDYKEEFEAWQNYYPLIANKEIADEQGYFFAILEAKIFKEGSMVIFGSNDITPTLYEIEENKQEPSHSDTLKFLTNNFKLNY